MGTKYCVKSEMICSMIIISSNQTKTNINTRKLRPPKVHKNIPDNMIDIINDIQISNY